ncbi:MAG: pyruvate dehydrogenase (acetyl-transferring) E1 component subunit alpha [Chloroflexi bacterium]|jgi:pyruvate dehydrogenase E1 component alpha subunit|nr:pyruvate dehydrogenase (acetyl-transferring) E1 component subunit alpha [Chloroflexota bacterium]
MVELNDDIGEEKRIELWKMLLKLRLVEKKAYDLFLENLIKGTSHLSLGQEAIGSAFGVALQKKDFTFCTYRGHAHTLSRGASIKGVLGELMGRESGLMRGKGGSMHLTDVKNGVMGSYAIVGAHLTIANGTAWASQYNKTGAVTTCFFGDGTTNIGAFHEALNLAQIWKLPVVFICENNFYMEYTPIKQVTAVENPAADRASAYNMEKIVVDGNDADEMYRAAKRAIEKARLGNGPSLIEAITYRHSGHSRADPAKYRPKEEAEEWIKNRDPVNIYRKRLIEFGINESKINLIENDIKKQIEEATEACKKSPEPSIDLIHKDVWANGGSEWHN